METHVKPVYLTIKISARANEILTAAARVSGRTKRQEAKLRLRDHLERFQQLEFASPSFPQSE